MCLANACGFGRQQPKYGPARTPHDKILIMGFTLGAEDKTKITNLAENMTLAWARMGLETVDRVLPSAGDTLSFVFSRWNVYKQQMWRRHAAQELTNKHVDKATNNLTENVHAWTHAAGECIRGGDHAWTFSKEILRNSENCLIGRRN